MNRRMNMRLSCAGALAAPVAVLSAVLLVLAPVERRRRWFRGRS